MTTLMRGCLVRRTIRSSEVVKMSEMRRVRVDYKDTTLSDIIPLVSIFEGYFDGDRRAVIFPFSEDLVEELENRGIHFTVEVM